MYRYLGLMASTGSHRFNPEALLMARLRLGKTQREVARECAELGQPVSGSNLSKYERGLFVPHPRALPVLAQVLGLAVDDLFERKAKVKAS
jgi:transcriptional regulator with XRE-family HTH domain